MNDKKENTMWEHIADKLYRKFTFKDFSEAFGFMARVALLAEAQQHHPVWTNSYQTVEIWLTTHDEGNKVTDKDRKLAQAIDNVL